MKKITLICLAISGLFLAASCCKDDNSKKEKTYLDYILTDYKALVDKYPEAKDRFVEARFTLDNTISEVPAAQIKAKSLVTICYAWLNGHSEIYVCERDFTTDQVELINYSADSPWLGDSQISGSVLKSLEVSLEKALDSAQKEAGKGDGLNTWFVTLRKSVYPFWDNPQYVFGGSASRHDHVFVDAKDGKVTILEGTADEGSSDAFMIDDYNKIVDVYKNDGQMDHSIELQGKMVELRYTLNKALNAVSNVDELAPEKAVYVFYYPAEGEWPAYLVSATRNSFKMGTGLEYSEEELTSPWTGGRVLGYEFGDYVISLEEAIFAVKLGPVTDTDTNEVTLCYPEGYEYPVYLFKGNNTPSVYVDAITGELL